MNRVLSAAAASALALPNTYNLFPFHRCRPCRQAASEDRGEGKASGRGEQATSRRGEQDGGWRAGEARRAGERGVWRARRERGEWRVADVMSTAYVCTHVAGAPPERPPAERVCKGEKRACGPMLQARARTMVSV